ncbi:3-hydroxyacyl-CoA dehydrogenase [Laceyella sacchari]|uniref:3-hydroxyacyl-CoA dehydrogenase family protein n=1 Tax=Laceyella sacchari TaxID=37482 RepID=UPI0010E1717C|nr:3-hydroxyacyl-CoA dehydrogenase NAD-binding domain-containing protein [Laceyella sacchari]TCW40564.1 3-hydroxyacyl-CoA dehydrogenase [Laceyella sacchari]
MSGSWLTTPAVVGAGTMGMGIAEVLAAAGYPVLVWEMLPTMMERARKQLKERLAARVAKGRLSAEDAEGMFERIQPVESLDELAKCELVIEAIVESLEAKQSLFAQLDELVSPTAVLASNTSSLSITAIAGATKRPDRVLGMHFFNPAPRMPLVEVVHGAQTAPHILEQVYGWLSGLGKVPVRVADAPGFLVNRVARSYHTEAVKLVAQQSARKEQVDRILEGAGFPMGPFKLQDLIGIDVNLAASVSVYEATFHEARFRPHYHQQRMVEQKALGRKTGKGHYEYGG